MYYDEFEQKVKDLYHKYFPNSMCMVKDTHILGVSAIDIRCYLANDTSELAYGYWDNDMFKGCFYTIEMPTLHNVKFEKDIEEIPNELKAYTLDNPTVFTKPDKSYLAYGVEYIRKSTVTGDVKKVLKWLDGQFKKLYDTTIKVIESDRVAPSYENIVATKVR